MVDLSKFPHISIILSDSPQSIISVQTDILGKKTSIKKKKKLKTYVLFKNDQPITHAYPAKKNNNTDS